MKRPDRQGGGSTVSAARRRPAVAVGVPLTLIHTNNSPNPVSMRLTALFDFPGGVTVAEAQNIISKRLKLDPKLAGLIVRRVVYGTT